MLPLIDSDDTKFNHGNAYWMTRFFVPVRHDESDNSSDKNAILDDLREENTGFRKVDSFFKDNAQTILLEHGKYLCAALKGSDEKKNYIDNVDIRGATVLCHALELEFHKGFHCSLSKVWKTLERSCEEHIKEVKKMKQRFLVSSEIAWNGNDKELYLEVVKMESDTKLNRMRAILPSVTEMRPLTFYNHIATRKGEQHAKTSIPL